METKRVGAPKKPPEEKMFPVGMRMKRTQEAKFDQLGRGEWLRKLLDAEIAKDEK